MEKTRNLDYAKIDGLLLEIMKMLNAIIKKLGVSLKANETGVVAEAPPLKANEAGSWKLPI